MTQNSTEYCVYVSQLRVGVFIRLNLRWFEHPFLFESFKIKNEEQIQILKQLGISTVTCVPEKSDQLPEALSASCPLDFVDLSEETEEEERLFREKLFSVKKERIQRLKNQRERLVECEKRFDDTLTRVKSVMRNLGTASDEVVQEASSLVGDMVDSFLSQKDVVVHLMNTKAGNEDIFYHSLNTAVLGMLLAKDCGLDAEAMQSLGMGLIFHDIGKHRIEKKILYKQAPLTPSELKIVQLHPLFGKEIISRMKQFPEGAIEIIIKHHETMDGKGYPDGLTNGKIPLPVKIASIANTYDNHCNKLDPKTSLTPNMALSFMFGKQREQYDPELLARFIRCLGVFPPGSIVLLSSGAVGIVVGVSSMNSLRPSVLIYDRDIPKNEALVIDMEEEEDISIVKSIQPTKLPKSVYDYLNPRTRVTYFMEPSQSGQQA